jgi:hypothetical protein
MSEPGRLEAVSSDKPTSDEILEGVVDRNQVEVLKDILNNLSVSEESAENEVEPSTEPYQMSSIPPHLRGIENRTLSSVDTTIAVSEVLTPAAVVQSSQSPTSEKLVNHTVDQEETGASEPSEPPKMEDKLWVAVIFSLKSESDLRALGSTCKALRTLVFDPSVVGSWLLRR